MTTYVVTRKSDQVEVYRYDSPMSIVPFETTFAVTAAGGSVNAIRSADE